MSLRRTVATGEGREANGTVTVVQIEEEAAHVLVVHLSSAISLILGDYLHVPHRSDSQGMQNRIYTATHLPPAGVQALSYRH